MHQNHVSVTDLRAGDESKTHWLHHAALIWENPLTAMLLALIAYAFITVLTGPLFAHSTFAYYNYLADAFLHGQLNLRVTPPLGLDLSKYHDKYYIYWAPLPAVLLMPFVALFGPDFSDVAFTVVIAALNVGLVALLLRRACQREVIALSALQRGLLVLFFAFGTVHLTLAPYGRVWFTGQLIAFMCVTLAYLATLTQRGWRAFALTGLALAGAMLTRNHLVLAGIWPACYLIYHHWSARWQRLIGYALVGALPIVVGLALIGVYDLLRFGSVFENGIAYHQMDTVFASDYQKYGAFNLHYLPTNVFYQYIAYPFPISKASYEGGSLFLLSPVFFAVFWGLAAGRPRWLAWALFATIMVVNIPILLLMGTGWYQFGPRYTLDFTVPLLLLTAMGVRRWPVWLLALLTLISMISYIIGTLYLGTSIAR
jgi:hypothetical protein